MSLRDAKLTEADASEPKRLSAVVSRFMADVRAALAPISGVQWHDLTAAVPATAAKVHVRAQKNGGQSFTSGSTAVITTYTEDEDTHGAFDASTGIFTAPRAGLYFIRGSVGFSPISAGSVKLSAVISGATEEVFGQAQAGAAGVLTVSGATSMRLAAGETVKLEATQTSGGAVNCSSGWATSISITEMEPDAPVVASCWPYDFLCDFDATPRGVSLAEVYEIDAQGRRSTAYVNAGAVDWQFITRTDAKGQPRPHIRVRNIPGLPSGKTYRIRLKVEE